MSELSKGAIQACHDIEGRTDDHDVRMAEIIQQAIDAATAKLREEIEGLREIIDKEISLRIDEA